MSSQIATSRVLQLRGRPDLAPSSRKPGAAVVHPGRPYATGGARRPDPAPSGRALGRGCWGDLAGGRAFGERATLGGVAAKFVDPASPGLRACRCALLGEIWPGCALVTASCRMRPIRHKSLYPIY
jgi:hypothetical protein